MFVSSVWTTRGLYCVRKASRNWEAERTQERALAAFFWKKTIWLSIDFGFLGGVLTEKIERMKDRKIERSIHQNENEQMKSRDRPRDERIEGSKDRRIEGSKDRKIDPSTQTKRKRKRSDWKTKHEPFAFALKWCWNDDIEDTEAEESWFSKFWENMSFDVRSDIWVALCNLLWHHLTLVNTASSATLIVLTNALTFRTITFSVRWKNVRTKVGEGKLWSGERPLARALLLFGLRWCGLFHPDVKWEPLKCANNDKK